MRGADEAARNESKRAARPGWPGFWQAGWGQYLHGARGGLVNGEIESVETLFSLMKNSDKDARVKVDKY
ncbi:hypothetical protein CSE6_005_06400 [Comamonas sp. E6]|nr:hypothetical protein CSE6_005_06400 [Comamonas sp. E6]